MGVGDLGREPSTHRQEAVEVRVTVLTTHRDVLHPLTRLRALHFGVVVNAFRQTNRAQFIQRLD